MLAVRRRTRVRRGAGPARAGADAVGSARRPTRRGSCAGARRRRSRIAPRPRPPALRCRATAAARMPRGSRRGRCSTGVDACRPSASRRGAARLDRDGPRARPAPAPGREMQVGRDAVEGQRPPPSTATQSLGRQARAGPARRLDRRGERRRVEALVRVEAGERRDEREPVRAAAGARSAEARRVEQPHEGRVGAPRVTPRIWRLPRAVTSRRPLPQRPRGLGDARACARVRTPPGGCTRTSRPSPVAIGRRTPGHQPRPARRPPRRSWRGLPPTLARSRRRVDGVAAARATGRAGGPRRTGRGSRGRRPGSRRAMRLAGRRRRRQRRRRRRSKRGPGHGSRGRREHEERVDGLRELRRAAPAVAELRLDPARIGEAAADEPGDVLVERARLRAAPARLVSRL